MTLRKPLKSGEPLICYCPPGVCQAPKGFSGPCNRASEQPASTGQLRIYVHYIDASNWLRVNVGLAPNGERTMQVEGIGVYANPVEPVMQQALLYAEKVLMVPAATAPANLDEVALAAAQEIALMWGRDRSQFVSRIQVAVRRTMETAIDASMLRNLLARIHRDGGHYVEQHGLDKALEDADSKVVEWLARDDAQAKGGQ